MPEQPPALFSDVSLLRLRHAFVGYAGPLLESLAHSDLGEQWRMSTVTVSAMGAVIFTTAMDFGEGDPFSDGVGDCILPVLRVASPRVERLEWRFAEPTSRKRSLASERLIFDLQHLDLDGLRQREAHLRRSMQRHVTNENEAVLAGLRLVAASHDTYWFLAHEEAGRSRVASTPGAAFALAEARQSLSVADDALPDRGGRALALALLSACRC